MKKIAVVIIFFVIQFFPVYAEGEAPENTEAETPASASSAETAKSANTVPPDVKAPESNPHTFVLDAGFTWVNNPKLTGGHFDFGLVLYKKILYIQSNILLRAGGLNIDDTGYSVFTISEKLIFGRNSETPLMIYTYVEGGVGIYGNSDKEFFKGPPAYSVGFGGGGEIASENFGGVYVEVGYLGQKINVNYPVGGVIIQAGMRIFF